MENVALNNELNLAQRIQSFARTVARTGETGLAIASADLIIPRLVQAMSEINWLRCANWRELAEAAIANKPSYFTLRKFPSTELYTFLAQRSRRSGALQIVDPETVKLHKVSIDRYAAPLLIITESLALSEIQKRSPIEDKVGLIEFFSTEDL